MSDGVADRLVRNGTLLVFAHREEAQAFRGVPHLVTGIGLVNAMSGLTGALAAGGVARVVVLGTAGLIDDALHLDTVYRVSEALQHDFEFPSPRALLGVDGSVRVVGERRGALGGVGVAATTPGADERLGLADRASGDSAHIVTHAPNAVIATGDSFVTDDALKAALLAEGVHLVDMESYGYATVCEVFRVPLEIYKVPSDFADSATTGETWDDIVQRKSEQLLDFARGLELL